MSLDTRTWIILLLLAAGLALILATPGLRQNIAAWLVWLATLFGGGAQEYERRQDSPPTPEPPDDSATPDDYERPPIEEDDDAPTPDPGDAVDADFWADMHDRGSSGD